MTILTDISALVKWQEKKELNSRIAYKMKKAGFEERGDRMLNCGTLLTVSVCPTCGKNHISSANLCRDRLCPTCAWRLSLKRFSEMCSTMQAITDLDCYIAGFLTLTVKNCDTENLRETISKMNADWNRFLQQRPIKRILVGWARSVEITYNKKTGQFHPHFHIITLTKDKETATESYLRTLFANGWDTASRLDYKPITDFRFISDRMNANEGGLSCDNENLERAILETYKYSVKAKTLEEIPLYKFADFVNQIRGLRFTAFGGIIKNARALLGYKDNQDEPDEIKEINTCCGQQMLDIFFKWSFSEQNYKVYADSISNNT